MTAQELRIGNWLHYSDVRIVKPERRNKDFQVIADDISYLSDYPQTNWIQPIPLTEEWFLKFGFEHSGGYLWNCKKIGENRFLNNPYSVTHFEIKGYFGKSHIQYVHQLQNLYFALTGEELTINQ
jgi:hypothetical protein